MPQSYASQSGGAAGDIYKPTRLQNDPLYNPLQGGVNQAGQDAYTALNAGKSVVAGPSNPLLRNKFGGGVDKTIGSYEVGPNGEVSYSEKEDPFSARLGALSSAGILNNQQSGGAGTNEPAREQGGQGDGQAAARAAAFAQGKDRAALIAQKGLEGVSNLMASRGIGGSTIEGGGIMDVFSGATNTLGNLSRDIAMSDAARSDRLADRDYAGNITQRGQDIDYRLGMENASNNRNQSLVGLINSIGAY